MMACSKDESTNDSEVQQEQGFNFEISGAINKTIKGKTAFFATGISKDIFERDLHTLVVSANDDMGDQVNIGITALEKAAGGNYDILLTIEPPYNGFVNYSEDPNNGKPIYGPIGGGIVLNSVSSNTVVGSIDAQCQIPGQNETVRVKGTFRAVSGQN
jgi:hypothetical protein